MLGVSVDTVRRWGDEGRIRVKRTQGGQRLIDGADLARFLRERATAADSSSQSARNRLHGIVTRVLKDDVMAQVEIQAGPHRLVSLMTREAADELELAPGAAAVAVVKSTNVIVELAL